MKLSKVIKSKCGIVHLGKRNARWRLDLDCGHYCVIDLHMDNDKVPTEIKCQECKDKLPFLEKYSIKS